MCFFDRQGFVSILALLILSLLTILGVSAISTTITELQIVRNEQIYKKNFYEAEGMAMEGAQTLEVQSNYDLRERPINLNWMRTVQGNDVENPDDDVDDEDMHDLDNWETGMNGNAMEGFSFYDSHGKNYFAAIDQGVARGSSLALDESQLHSFSVFGLHEGSDGTAMIQIGYKKRF